jgi:hypothetical protein
MSAFFTVSVHARGTQLPFQRPSHYDNVAIYIQLARNLHFINKANRWRAQAQSVSCRERQGI